MLRQMSRCKLSIAFLVLKRVKSSCEDQVRGPAARRVEVILSREIIDGWCGAVLDGGRESKGRGGGRRGTFS